MFWRRKNDGFEWHKYVRTTIKLRRDDRRRRVKAAKDAAIDGLENAGRAGLQAGRSGAASLGAATVAGVNKLWRGGRAAAVRAFGAIGWAALYSARALGRGVMVGARAVSHRAAVAWSACQHRIPLLTRVPRQVAAAALSLGTLLAVGVGLLGARHLPATGFNPLALLPGFGPTVIEGRATAITGDTLRVDAKLIRLVGIEAPELDQRCGATSRTAWRCGTAAQSGLRDLLRTRSVRCEAGGSDASGRTLATCQAGGRDLAAELAGKGLVFADEGLFSRYGAREREAREAKLGIWRTANTERPKAYREHRWEVARRTAPEGCPIKGHVVAGDRVYVLPWSPQYERVRVREQRGGRWFCSETEAQAAGWRPIQRS